MDIAAFIASFVAQFTGVEAGLMAALAAVAAFLPADEQTILYNALKAAQSDIAAGKPVGTAIADAWTAFYAGEQGEVGKVGQFIMAAILTALAPKV